MLKKIVTGLTISIHLVFASATIIDGTDQTITFNSMPDSAKVAIDGVLHCTTPCSLKLDRESDDKNISFSKDGYDTVTIPLTSSYNGVAVLSILWDYSTTDLLSGAAFQYDQSNVMVELKAKSGATSKTE